MFVTILILFLTTAAVFLILDAVMLATVMKPLFDSHIGALMTPDVRVAPAALFYLGYVAGVIFLVSWQGYRDDHPVLLRAFVLGALAYGTFEFTNYAILKDWHPNMVMADVTWGAVLTAVSAWAGVAITRWLLG